MYNGDPGHRAVELLSVGSLWVIALAAMVVGTIPSAASLADVVYRLLAASGLIALAGYSFQLALGLREDQEETGGGARTGTPVPVGVRVRR